MESTVNKHYLYPASLYVSKQEVRVSTILGTCVAVCLYDQLNQVGGINHFMLPEWDRLGIASSRFGDAACRQLLERMLSMGAQKKHMVAKIFGGLSRHQEKDNFNIGRNNVKAAEAFLEKYQIALVARSTGGSSPRKLIFNTSMGTVDMQLLLPAEVFRNQ